MQSKHQLLSLLFVALGAGAVACATTTTKPAPASQPAASAAVPGASLGLVKGQPGVNQCDGREAGQTSPLAREFIGAPPAVPHSVVGQQISRKANACLDCHLEGVELEAGHQATKLSASHFDGAGRDEAAVSGGRYGCLQCHLPQTTGAVPAVVRP